MMSRVVKKRQGSDSSLSCDEMHPPSTDSMVSSHSRLKRRSKSRESLPTGTDPFNYSIRINLSMASQRRRSSSRKRVGSSESLNDTIVSMNNYYFVKPEDEISSLMNQAFQLVAGLGEMSPCKWISESDIKKQALICNKGSIFVLQKFSGAFYEDLLHIHKSKNKNFMIIGPHVLCYMFEHGMDEYLQNNGKPIYSLAMKDVVVSTTGFQKGEISELKDKVTMMGGQFELKYTIALTHLIASTVLSDKGRLAREKDLPIMNVNWVKSVFEKCSTEIVHCTDSEFSIYKCPLFYNIQFSISQFQRSEKETFQKIIIENGGIYSDELNAKGTNILIVSNPTGDKFRYAKAWNVHCVRPDWIYDSLDKGYVLEFEKYTVQGLPLNSTLVESGKNFALQDECYVSSIKPDVSAFLNSQLGAGKYLPSQATSPDPPCKENNIEEIGGGDGYDEVEPAPVPVPTSSRASSASSTAANTVVSNDFFGEATVQNLEPEPLENFANTPEPSSSIFNGKRLKISFASSIDSQNQIREFALQLGATIVEENYDYVITSPVITEEESKLLYNQAFTKYWMMDCDELTSTDIPFAFYHKPSIFSPNVEHIMDGIVCSVSAYSTSEREYISELARSMGAVVQDVFSKKKKNETLANTHLICKTNENQKYEAAVRWKIPVATSDWILKCFTSRQLLDSKRFVPGVYEDEDSTSSNEILPTTPIAVTKNLAKNDLYAKALCNNIQKNLACEILENNLNPGEEGAHAAASSSHCLFNAPESQPEFESRNLGTDQLGNQDSSSKGPDSYQFGLEHGLNYSPTEVRRRLYGEPQPPEPSYLVRELLKTAALFDRLREELIAEHPLPPSEQNPEMNGN